MQTQCPSCKSVFRVTLPELSAAGGLVRCGQCGAVFNGNDHIKRLRSGKEAAPAMEFARAPDVTPPSAPAQPTDSAAAAATQAPGGRSDDAGPSEQARPAHAEVPAHPRVEFYLDPGLAGPSRRRSLKRWAAAFLMVAILLGGAGYLYHERVRLADYPQLAEWVGRACAYLGCELSPRRDARRITLVERNVYSRPDRPDVLFIAATLINRARFAQPYPLMQVSFTNLQGTVIAARRFEPHEYLAKAPGPEALMPPNARIKVAARMPDPGRAVSAFEFAFF